MKMGTEFEITLEDCGSMSDMVALEATAMFSGGRVQDSSVICYGLDLRVEKETTGTLRIHGIQTSNKHTTIVAIYCVMAGFWRSNCSVQYSGQQSSYFPGNGEMLRSVSKSRAILKPFEQLRPNDKRAKPVSFKEIEQAHLLITKHNTLDSLTKSDDVRSHYPGLAKNPKNVEVRLRSELRIQFEINDYHPLRHVILGYTPGPAIQEYYMIDDKPTEVETWGDAWVSYEQSHESKDCFLEVFPNEIGLFATKLNRYTIKDRQTLKRLSKLSFGPADQSRYTSEQMIQFGRFYLENDGLKKAKACFAQAKQLGAKHVDTVEAEWLFKRPVIKLRPLSELSTVLTQSGMEKFKEVEHERSEVSLYSDGGRLPHYTMGGVRFETITLKQSEAWGMTERTIAYLLDMPSKYINPEEPISLFWFVAGDHKVWGYERTNRYFIEGNPNYVFGSKPWS